MFCAPRRETRGPLPVAPMYPCDRRFFPSDFSLQQRRSETNSRRPQLYEDSLGAARHRNIVVSHQPYREEGLSTRCLLWKPFVMCVARTRTAHALKHMIERGRLVNRAEEMQVTTQQTQRVICIVCATSPRIVECSRQPKDTAQRRVPKGSELALQMQRRWRARGEGGQI